MYELHLSKRSFRHFVEKEGGQTNVEVEIGMDRAVQQEEKPSSYGMENETDNGSGLICSFPLYSFPVLFCSHITRLLLSCFCQRKRVRPMFTENNSAPVHSRALWKRVGDETRKEAD